MCPFNSFQIAAFLIIPVTALAMLWAIFISDFQANSCKNKQTIKKEQQKEMFGQTERIEIVRTNSTISKNE